MTWLEFRENPGAQRKALILLAVVFGLVALLVLPSPSSWLGGQRVHSPARSRRPVRGATTVRASIPSVGLNAPPVIAQQAEITALPVPPAPVVPSGPASPLAALAGFWKSQAELPPNRGLCFLHLELVSLDKDGKEFSAITVMSCGPSLNVIAGKSKLTTTQYVLGLSPVSAKLTGTANKDGTIHFAVQKNIGVSQSVGCSMTAATVTLCINQIAFEFQESGDSCRGGAMVMARTDK